MAPSQNNIDEEVKKLIEECHLRTLDLLRQKKNELEALAHELLQKEILYKHDLERLIGKRPYEPKHVYEENGQDPAQTADSANPNGTPASQQPSGTSTQQQPVSETGVS